MSGQALAFMIGSWSFVLGLTGWCFHRVLRSGRGGPSGPSHQETSSSGTTDVGRLA